MLSEWEPGWCLIRRSKLSVTGVENKELQYNNSMKIEQIIEIAEEIEKQYMELGPDEWYAICEVLLQRAN